MRQVGDGMHIDNYNEIINIIENVPVMEWPGKIVALLKSLKNNENIYLAYREAMEEKGEGLNREQREMLVKLIPTVLRYGRPRFDEYIDALYIIYPMFREFSEKESLAFINGLLLSITSFLENHYGRNRYQELMEELEEISHLGQLGVDIARGACHLIKENYSSRPALMEEVQELLDFLEGESELDLTLNDAVEGFFQQPSQRYFLKILELIVEENIFVPVSSPIIQPRKAEIWKYPKPGLLYTVEDEIYIPVFTEEDKAASNFLNDMGYELLRIPFSEVVRRTQKDPSCKYDIVINPFSEPIQIQDHVLEELWQLKKDQTPELKVIREEKDNITEFPQEVLKDNTGKEISTGNNVIDLDKYR
ncbi:MAG: hypothetical protein Q4Q07_08140 [Tissierellia bacterium]|nr:hypothetical protein [Tissierellia bacterium]